MSQRFRATSDVIACTLSPADLADAGAAWQRLFRESLISRTEIPGGLRLNFHPGSAEAVRQLVDIERECCAWINFELDGATVTMTSPGAGEEVIRQTWSLRG
jgi:hypothetical protein